MKPPRTRPDSELDSQHVAFPVSNAVVADILELCKALPVAIHPLSGGCIGEVYRVDFEGEMALDSDRIVIKVGNADSQSLAIEGEMLGYLAAHSTLPIPRIHLATDTLLVMDWLPGESKFSSGAQTHAAQLLAQLHQVTSENNQYGFDSDTLIGGLAQPNPWTASWLDFLAEHRLLYMAIAAFEEKKLSKEVLRRVDKFSHRLDRWLTEPLKPTLLHGDVWTTNVLADGDRITGFIDPAVYYGHPEIELAFTTLFGTFDTPFFKQYQEISSLDEGFFEIRRDLYNLYPLLVHVRLFGEGYVRSVEATLSRVGC